VAAPDFEKAGGGEKMDDRGKSKTRGSAEGGLKDGFGASKGGGVGVEMVVVGEIGEPASEITRFAGQMVGGDGVFLDLIFNVPAGASDLKGQGVEFDRVSRL